MPAFVAVCVRVTSVIPACNKLTVEGEEEDVGGQVMTQEMGWVRAYKHQVQLTSHAAG